MAATVARELDCVVVGAGAAGLSAAVNLGRLRRSVLLVDERDRFLWRHVAHNYLGFPDGIQGVDLRRLGWRHAAKYGVQLLLGHVASAAREDDRFRLRIERLPEGGPWAQGPGPTPPRDAEMARLFAEVPEAGPMDVLARTVILATGVYGHFPEFAGRDECVGRSLFWCIHCEGYESIETVPAALPPGGRLPPLGPRHPGALLEGSNPTRSGMMSTFGAAADDRPRDPPCRRLPTSASRSS